MASLPRERIPSNISDSYRVDKICIRGKIGNHPSIRPFFWKNVPTEGRGPVQAPVPPQASSATATYTLEISYQTAKSTLPVWGRWKIFWNSVTASWVAGP